MNPECLKNIEQTLEELYEVANNCYHKTRSIKNTFVSLSFFLTGKFKGDGLEYITPQECDLLRHFRKLTPELKLLYDAELKKVAEMVASNAKEYHYVNSKLSLEDLKNGMDFNPRDGSIHKLNNCHYHGYCYIGIDTNWYGFYKIGKTIDPSCKSRTSHSINPNYKIIYRTKDLYKNVNGLEEKIHHQLSDFRIENQKYTEWFKLSDEQLNSIINKYNFIKLEEINNTN